MSNLHSNAATGSYSGIGINADIRDPAALFEMRSDNQGMLFPRMTETQIGAIATPPNGLFMDNTTTAHLNVIEPVGIKQIQSVLNPNETIFFSPEPDFNIFNYAVKQVGQNGDMTISAINPPESTDFIDIRMVYFATAGAAGFGKSITLNSSYAQPGQLNTTNQETNTLSQIIAPTNIIFDFSIMSVFSSIPGGEFKMGFNLKHNNIGGTMYYLFAKIVWSR